MSDMDGSAWDDINPPMTASAQQQGRLSRSLAKLEPATNEQFRNELTACLALVAPVGMTEEAKRDWLRVAWATLGHLPADVLSSACNTARQKCDHPSKIVPAILEAAQQTMRWRTEAAREAHGGTALPKPDYCTPEQAAAILKEFGLK